jgi:hypothetical protein
MGLFVMRDMTGLLHNMKPYGGEVSAYPGWETGRFVVTAPNEQDWCDKVTELAIDIREFTKHPRQQRGKNGALEAPELHLGAILGLKMFDEGGTEEIGGDVLDQPGAAENPRTSSPTAVFYRSKPTKIHGMRTGRIDQNLR